MYVPVPVEITALDILHRADWKPVTRAAVDTWFEDRARHGPACPCWRCEAAARAGADRVWKCLQAWRRTDGPPRDPVEVESSRPLPERARMLRATGLTMQEIAAQLQRAPSTVYGYLHNA